MTVATFNLHIPIMTCLMNKPLITGGIQHCWVSLHAAKGMAQALAPFMNLRWV